MIKLESDRVRHGYIRVFVGKHCGQNQILSSSSGMHYRPLRQGMEFVHESALLYLLYSLLYKIVFIRSSSILSRGGWFLRKILGHRKKIIPNLLALKVKIFLVWLHWKFFGPFVHPFFDHSAPIIWTGYTDKIFIVIICTMIIIQTNLKEHRPQYHEMNNIQLAYTLTSMFTNHLA